MRLRGLARIRFAASLRPGTVGRVERSGETPP